MTKKVKKKKLNIKRTLVFILFIYIIGFGIYYIINQPIRHIEITGTNLINDNEILRISKLDNYPSMLKYSNNTIEKKIKQIKLVDEVKVKKWFGSVVKINIKENKLLFYYKDQKKIVLSSGDIINNNLNNVYGLPIFSGNIKSNLLKKFIANYKNIDDNIIYEMNEILHEPLKNEEGKILTEDRFKIIMNDGNTILTNTKSVSVINKYNDIYASLGGKLGTINLDTNEVSNLIFIPYEE